jgi:hypothetical protein
MTLEQLLQTSEQDRNLQWENQFLKALTESNVSLLSQDPQTGPDGWPYLLVEAGGVSTQPATESAQKVLAWLATRGIGLAVNPRKDFPDYVFSYGMIWSFKETGYFYQPAPTVKDGRVEFENVTLKQAGDAVASYLPVYVRTILRDFLREQGILRPKILVISQDGKNYDLAFSLESLGNPPAAEHLGIGEAIAWFLPPHYSLVLVSEKGLPPFFDL